MVLKFVTCSWAIFESLTPTANILIPSDRTYSAVVARSSLSVALKKAFLVCGNADFSLEQEVAYENLHVNENLRANENLHARKYFGVIIKIRQHSQIRGIDLC